MGKTAYLVMGEAVCFDPKLFQQTVEADKQSPTVEAELAQQQPQLGFALCFETHDPAQARRWAILANMQSGARVTKVTAVHRSFSHQQQCYCFYVDNHIVAREPYPIPSPESEKSDDSSLE